MKKTLIALAAVAATGVAFAQSSVTLYGVADAGISKITDQSAAFSSAGLMNNGTSRWGVRGTEDLGGGLKAGFNFEAGLSLADGSTGQGGGNYFSRASWMNLTGGFGELRLGRSLNPSFFAAAAWELTGAANYSAVVAQFGSVLGGVRNSNQFAYTTPNMGGFSSTIGYVLKTGTPEGQGAKVDLNAIYKNGPLAVALGYNKVGDVDGKNFHIGAAYSFGDFRVAGAFIDPNGDARGFAIGGGMNAGPVSLVVDIARDTESKETTTLLEAKYPLSKRTTAYAAYLNRNQDRPNGLGIGIRHNF